MPGLQQRISRYQRLFAPFVVIGLAQLNLLAQTPPIIPPGVPEPGLVVWGSVVNATNVAEPVSIWSVAWTVTDGSNTVAYDDSTRPPTQIAMFGGRSHYVLEVPFDTRTFGSVSLARPTNSFELKNSSPPVYTLVPTINGVPASVRSIDSAPASGTNVLQSGFSAAIRGKVVRVDLAILPPAEPYDVWAAQHWGSATHPDAARELDPDGDGLTNDAEHKAGTDPTSAASALRILTLTMNAGQPQVTVNWESIANKNYRLEAAADINGPWLEVGTPVSGAGATTQTSVLRDPADAKLFYRVRLLP